MASSSRGGMPVKRIRGPTQLKRHLEKQKDLLEEAKKMLQKELELLQAEETILKSKLAELTQPPPYSIFPPQQQPQQQQQQQQQHVPPVVEDVDLMSGRNLPELNLSTKSSNGGEGKDDVESDDED